MPIFETLLELCNFLKEGSFHNRRASSNSSNNKGTHPSKQRSQFITRKIFTRNRNIKISWYRENYSIFYIQGRSPKIGDQQVQLPSSSHPRGNPSLGCLSTRNSGFFSPRHSSSQEVTYPCTPQAWLHLYPEFLSTLFYLNDLLKYCPRILFNNLPKVTSFQILKI